MNKPEWRIEHAAMRHGFTSTDWSGGTPEEAVVGFLEWCDRRGEFIDVFGVRRIKNLQERIAEEFASGYGSTVGD